jgi:hypothetical protein
VALVKCQDIVWFGEPRHKNEDERGLKACILVNGVVMACHNKAPQYGGV